MRILDYVKKFDPQNQFEVLIKTYEQIEFAWNNPVDLSSLKDKKFSSIIVTGLGGSAISADLMQNFLRDELKVPFIVNRNYFLPSFANENTLVIVSSYSGNTEETVEVFNSALKRKCAVFCITTGGKVEKIANDNNVPVIKVLPGYQPRYTLGLSFFTLLKSFQTLNIISEQSSIVDKITAQWKLKGNELSQDDNEAFGLAESLIGFIPTIYSAADLTSAVGYRLKCQFNENSKLHAFHNIIPEMNHNEIIGWESFSEKQFNTKLITILDAGYPDQIKKRFAITSELATKAGAEVIQLESEEPDYKLRLMELIYFGDWITYYTAILRGFDPTEIENINILKQRLS
jgi:glucose/mannose-6-phosphate isomerase